MKHAQIGSYGAETIDLPREIDVTAVLGPANQTIRVIEKGFPDVEVAVSGRQVRIFGESTQVPVVAGLVRELVTSAQRGLALNIDTVAHAVELLRKPKAEKVRSGLSLTGRSIRAKTPGQQAYLDALDENQITIAIGPAGTGKTYLAMAKAVEALLSGQVRRLVLTRPAVEAGENLGYLPGTLTEKINPYLRPLYDALQDLLEEGALPKLMESGAIEVAPLAYMRGRTLNDAYVIVDEAQNTLPAQMKMVLTRLGHRSKMAVTGDVTQVDLGSGQVSGLTQAEEILKDVAGVKFCYLTSSDVVRTQIVADIVDAYEEWDERHPRTSRDVSRRSGYQPSTGSKHGR